MFIQNSGIYWSRAISQVRKVVYSDLRGWRVDLRGGKMDLRGGKIDLRGGKMGQRPGSVAMHGEIFMMVW